MKRRELEQPVLLTEPTQPLGLRRNIHPKVPWHPLPHVQEYMDTKSEGTRKNVRRALARFSLWCRDHNIEHPGQITRSHLLMYLDDLPREKNMIDNQPLAPTYTSNVFATVMAWMRWLLREGYIEANVWTGIKVPKPGPGRDMSLAAEEIGMLFDVHRAQAFRIPPFFFHRREVLLTLLFGWGLQLTELHSLNVAQMDMRLEWVTIAKANSKVKRLPYPDELKGVVQRYLIHRARYAQVGEDALIIDQTGKRMNPNRIAESVQRLGQRANITASPRRLRDAFVTTMADNGAAMDEILGVLGQGKSRALDRVKGDDYVKAGFTQVMSPILKTLTTGIGQTRGLRCECVVKHPATAFEAQAYRNALSRAVLDNDALAIQVHTAQLTTPCPGLLQPPVGIESETPNA